MQRLCGANMDVPLGRAVYTGMFNSRGAFESDLTAVRVSRDRILFDQRKLANHARPRLDSPQYRPQ